MFLNRTFEYGGTIANLDLNKGNYKGVYIVVCPDDIHNHSLKEHSNAGKYKGKDPTIAIAELKKKIPNKTKILYIGKSEKSVLKRIQQHVRFWYGEPIAAWGGRAIAQLESFDTFEVWYLQSDNPKATEKTLLNDFKSNYGNLPLANWRI